MITKRYAFLRLGSASESDTGVEQEQHGGGDQRPEAASGDRSGLTEPNEHSSECQAPHREHCARDRSSPRPTSDSTAQMLHHHASLPLPLTTTDTDHQPASRDLRRGARIQLDDAPHEQHHSRYIDNMRYIDSFDS